MTDQNAIRDDIAFMRSLAEEGRNGPLVGGSILLVAGLAFGSASLVNWVIFAWRLTRDAWIVNGVWMAAMVVFMAYLFLSGLMKGRFGSASRAVGVAWSGAGWSMFFVGLSLGIMAYRGHDAYVALVFMPFILAMYGSAWFVAATLTRARWLYAVAAGAFLMALVAAWFAVEGAILYLIYALSLYLLVAAPGFVLMRQARQAGA
jgi:hypothetical protein